MSTSAKDNATVFPDVLKGLPQVVAAVCAGIILAVASPVLLVCAIAIALDSRGPIFFRQMRMGRHGKPFRLWKLRTMTVSSSGPKFTADGDDRITCVGRWLRLSKIDELPGFWNVLKGDMSLVGPRPEVSHYVDLTDARWLYVLAARPGITDPVTLRLRNEQAILAAVEADNREAFYRGALIPYKLSGYIDYISGRSWRTDLQVLKNTALAVLFPWSASDCVSPSDLRKVLCEKCSALVPVSRPTA